MCSCKPAQTTLQLINIVLTWGLLTGNDELIN